MNIFTAFLQRNFRNFLLVTFFVVPCFSSLQAINEVLYSSNQQGLSSSYFQDMLQDSQGYMWIATEYGLNRYDGYNFKKYYKNQGDERSLNSSFVMSLYEDSHGRIWVGTSIGLNLYDRKNDNFRRMKLMRNGVNQSTTVYSIVELENGEMYVPTSQGIVFVLSDTADVFDENVEFKAIPVDSIPKGGSILYQDSEQNIWFASESGGLYSIENRVFSSVSYNGKSICGINSFTEDSFGNLYVGSVSDGFYIKKKSESTLRKISSLVNIRDMYFRADENDILIATDGNGVFSYRIGNGVISQGIPGTILTDDLDRMKVHKIIQDRDGNLWLGIYHKGVMSIKKGSNKFEYIGRKSYQNNIIGQSAVLSLLKSRNGKLYVGTDGDGFFEVDRERGTARNIHLMTDRKRERGVAIMNIYEDSKGGLWLSTFKNGLYYVSPDRTQCSSVPLSDRLNIGVVNVVEDNFHNIIVTTYSAGVYEYNPTTGVNKRIPDFSPTWINSVRKNTVGDVIFCTTDGMHIMSYHNNNRRIESFPILANEVVLSYEDGWGNDMWINSQSGVYLYNPEKDPSIVRINDKFPVLNCKIQGLIMDNNGALWISSNQGLYCLHPSLNELDEYYDIDGIQSNEFCGTAMKGRLGRLYFGGIGGITHFLPDNVKTDFGELNVYLSEFETENGPLIGLDRCSNFDLNYDEETFSMRFTTLNLVESKQIKFFYRISNLYPEWQEVKAGDNVLKFSNLPFGKHELEVYALQDRNLISPIKKYTIRINPPWHLTLLAKIVYVLLFVICFVVLFLYKKREKKRKENLFILQNREYLNDEKLKYFVNVSHEIKTPLSMIVAPLEQLLKGKRESKSIYQMMYKNATKILNLIGEVADIQQIDKNLMTLKLQSTDLVLFINHIVKNMEYNVNLKNQNVVFQHQSPVILAMVDRLAFEKIIANLLSNAIKYTQVKGNITIYIKELPETQQVKIVVQDDGPGIEADLLPHVFKRFYKGTKGNVSGSTGIGLNLTASLVELHNGEIKAENRNEVSGARFVVTIPQNTSGVAMEEPEALFAVEEKKNTVEDAVKVPSAEELKVGHPTVLIVDDEVEIRKYVSSLLNEKYEVIEAVDGLEALEIAMKQHPDIIISDIMMPKLNGVAMVSKIRRNPQLHLIPVILLTAKTSNEDKLEGLRLGADAFISKPFNVDILLTTIHNLVSRQKNMEKHEKIKFHYENDIERVEAEGNDEKFVKLLNRILSENLSNPDFNVNTLCTDMLISRMQLHRKMKSMFNTTASEYLRNMRLNEAARLLKETDLNISEIAYMVGFNNASHFSATFKQSYGLTPKEFTLAK